MTATITWTRGAKVHSTSRVDGKLVEIARDRKHHETRRRNGWHTYWYARVDGGPWTGDSARAVVAGVSMAGDGHLGFSTMKKAKAAAVRMVRS